MSVVALLFELVENHFSTHRRSRYGSKSNNGENSIMDNDRKIINDDLALVEDALGPSLRQRLAGKTLLVAGSNGLIGSFLVEMVPYLNDRGLEPKAHVIGLSKSVVTANSRLGHLLGRPDVRLVVHDVANTFDPGQKIDFIIHAAGFSAPADFMADPLNTIDLAVQGVRWLLDLAVKNNSESFLYVSSSEIYGSPSSDKIPTPETYNGNVDTKAPRACYTEGKRLAEVLCFAYQKKFNLPVKIVRPALTYGPGMPIADKRVMVDFIRKAKSGEGIVMQSPGLDQRCYCYLADAVTAFWQVLFSTQEGEVFNVGNPNEEVTIKQLAQMTHDLFGLSAAVRAPEPQEGFMKDAPSRVMLDISKMRQAFGWEPKVNLRQGLTKTINWILAREGRTLISDH